jgi:hypothetical protein
MKSHKTGVPADAPAPLLIPFRLLSVCSRGVSRKVEKKEPVFCYFLRGHCISGMNAEGVVCVYGAPPE